MNVCCYSHIRTWIGLEMKHMRSMKVRKYEKSTKEVSIKYKKVSEKGHKNSIKDQKVREK